jgi:hypothetical protein
MTDAWSAWRAHRDRARPDSADTVEQPTICRFSDCDRDATDTVGTMALCALHRSFIDQMMDDGTGTEPSAGTDLADGEAEQDPVIDDGAAIVLPLIHRASSRTDGDLRFRPSS